MIRIQGESTGCVLSRCLLACSPARPPAHSPARRPGSQFEVSVQPSSVLGPGALLPIIHGPQPCLVLSKSPGKKAALSPWPGSPCGVQCVSLLCHTLPAYAGGASSPRKARPVPIILVLLRCQTSRPCPRPPPPYSSILSDARGSSRNEVTPPQTCPLVSMRSLLHLLGLKLFRGAGTVYPRDTPVLLLPRQILRPAPSPCSPPSLASHCPSHVFLLPAWTGLSQDACPQREQPISPSRGEQRAGLGPVCLPAGSGSPVGVAPGAQAASSPQGLTDLAPCGGREACFEASHLPSACSRGRGCACASVCVAECITRVCGGREGSVVSPTPPPCVEPHQLPPFTLH